MKHGKNYERRIFEVDGLKVVTREDGPPKIGGYAARFNKYSEDFGGFREKIKPGAFKEALGKSDVRALFNHDPNFVLGRQKAGTLDLKEDSKGLWMEVELPDTQFARDLMHSIDRGDITQQSFGFTLAEGGATWKRHKEYGEVRTIEKVEQLYDVSPVTYPAYPETDVALRSLEDWRNESEEDSKEMITIELPEGITEEEIRSLIDEKIQAKSETQTRTENEPDPEKPTLSEDKLDRVKQFEARVNEHTGAKDKK